MNTVKDLRILTIPNLISICRILLLIPISISLWNDNISAFFILAFISFLSDYLDGYIARRFNQVSEFGKMLDPLGDKFSICVVLTVLYFKNLVPLWLLIIVLGRDIVILISSFFVARKYKFVVTSNFLGKITVNVLSLTILVYIFDIVILEKIFSILTAVFIFLSSFSYFKRHRNLIKTEKP